jgi:hypothetical protein
MYIRLQVKVDCVSNVMAHAQKPDFVFRRKGRVHLNWWGRQFCRLLAAEVCASALMMLDTPRSEVVWRVPTPFASFPFTPPPPVRQRVPSNFNLSLPAILVIFQWDLDSLNRLSTNTNISNYMEIRPVGTEFSMRMERTDGQTDRSTGGQKWWS